MTESNLFETGATTAQANNLVLSVLNDGTVYETRKHIAWAMFQGTTHRGLSFRDLASNEATKQRQQGCKFKAEHITEAAKLIRAETIEHVLECLRDEYTGDKVIAECRRYWDKTNGNSYFSVWVQIPVSGGFKSICIPFQYGYGSQWEYETVDMLARIGVWPPFPKYANGDTNRGYLSELPIIFRDTGYTQKRNMFEGIVL